MRAVTHKIERVNLSQSDTNNVKPMSTALEQRSVLEEMLNDVSIQCRFRWTKGAVAVWDERSTQHSGAADHRGSPRTLRRCTIAGERPE